MNPGMTAIRVFRADAMNWTPFAVAAPLHPILAACVTFVDDPSEADIIIASSEPSLQPYGSCDRRFAIWTHEPRLNYRIDPVVRVSGIRNPVHIMNAYSGGIYADKFYYFYSLELDFDKMMQMFVEKPRRAVMLASYRPSPTRAFFDDRSIDLQEYRQQLAVHLNERGFCDIYGRGWPPNIRIVDNSREGRWGEAKREILQKYVVNIAFENTIIPNYVTEKIWDAVVNACLPVYHGVDNGIYEIFPAGSFLEASAKSVESLADEIINMSRDEMETRYAACLRAYMSVAASDPRRLSRQACLVRTIRFLDSILSYGEARV
jgi:Glycosyltransferase family 10 (fucosyltransferase) C-term